MLAQADEHQIPMVLALPGCYLRWPPNQSQTPPQEGFDPNAFETRIQATKALVRRGVPGDGARLVKECPDHAAAHYWQARQLDQAGDLAAAAAEFQQALDLDCLPLRGQSSHGAVLQALAERHQVPYLDLRALFLHENGGRAPGGELFIDHCHPRPRGQYLMAREFARTLCDQGKLAPKERWHWDRLPTYAACLERIGLTAPQWRDAERKVIGGVFASAPEVAAELTAEPPPLANADDPEWRALNVLAEWKCGRPGPAEKLWAAQGGNLHAALAPVLRQWPSNVQADWARMIGALTPKAAD
jgi:hypothetical protein